MTLLVSGVAVSTTNRSEPHALAFRRVGRWRLCSSLGVGGQGHTWRALSDDGRVAALKLLADAPGDELRALWRVAHPCVARVLDANAHPRPYVAMALAPGRPLPAQPTAWPEEAVWLFATALLDGLATVHRAGIVHGDLKPANIVVDPERPEQPVIVDFGMAGRALGGTPAFAAPERVDGAPASPAGDVYAAALLIWELLSGTRPYPSQDEGGRIADRCRQAPPPPPGDPALSGWLVRCLSPAPQLRPTAEAMVQVLEDAGYPRPEVGPDHIRRRAGIAWVPRPELDAAVDDWLQRGSCLAIMGAPGSGRTRALDRIAVELNAKGRAVHLLAGGPGGAPVLVQLQQNLGQKPSTIDPDDPVHAWDTALGPHLGPHPIVLIDDADALDGTTVGLLRAWVRERGARVAVTSLRAPPWTEFEVCLDPLNEAQTRALAAQLFDGTAGLDTLANAALQYAGGSPEGMVHYFVSAVDAGVLRRIHGNWTLSVDDLDNVLEVAVSTADALPTPSPDAAEIGRWVALSLDGMSTNHLARLARISPFLTELGVHELVDKGLVVVEHGVARCVSARVAGHLLLGCADRTSRHARALRILQSDPTSSTWLMAHHALSAGQEAVARALGPEGVRTLCKLDPHAAVTLSERLWLAVPHEAMAVARLHALVAADRIAAARVAARQILDLGPPPTAIGPTLLELASRCLHDGAAASEAQAFLAGARMARDEDTEDTLGQLLEAEVWLALGHVETARAHAASIARQPAQDDTREIWLRARHLWARALRATGQLTHAIQVLAEIPTQHLHAQPEGIALTATLGAFYWEIGRQRDALAALRRARQGQRHLPRRARAQLLCQLAQVQQQTGDRPAALASWEQATILQESLGEVRTLGATLLLLSEGYQESGQASLAETQATRAFHLGSHHRLAVLECRAARRLGELALSRAEFPEARVNLERAANLASSHQLGVEAAATSCRRAALEVEVQTDDAEAHVHTAIDEAVFHGLPVAEAHAVALLSLCRARKGCDPQELDTLAKRAMTALRNSGRARALAEVRRWLAEAQMIQGRHEEASRTVAELELFADEVDSEPLRAHACRLRLLLEQQRGLTHQERELTSLVELAAALCAEPELSTLLGRIAEGAAELVGGDRAFVLMGESAEVVARSAGAKGQPSRSIVNQAMSQRREVMAVDLKERGDLRALESVHSLELQSVLCSPLIHHDQVIGAIYVDSQESRRGQVWRTGQLLRCLSSLAAAAIAKADLHERAIEAARRAARLESEERAARRNADLARELALKNNQISRLNRRLREASKTDVLTGTHNRRHFQEMMEATHAGAQQGGAPYGLLIADVDHFKRFNDTHGHPAGDRALCAVAEALRDSLRATDSVYRYGGEELVIISLDARPDALSGLAERLRRAVAETQITLSNGHQTSVTVSIGFSSFDGADSMPWSQVVKRADQALYAAKDQGRNRCLGWDAISSTTHAA